MSRMDAAKGAVELGASQRRFDKPASCRREWRSHNISRKGAGVGPPPCGPTRLRLRG
ncbi:TPA: hypothetical protein ACHJX8_001970 [Yersinia enterocolitica]|uniref:hypothetical protein n=1 Tax=Yersinia TaxID=629 RepID=UPI001595E274|nr:MULTISPECIES: hypothetical protein [Yersinia]